ncbi:hypothetical protein BDQ17DRAFT_1298485 [Cyathus striatus]|nr:hypothetical protein BDQ17DRAFT_1298485 [Cyathus striatus]
MSSRLPRSLSGPNPRSPLSSPQVDRSQSERMTEVQDRDQQTQTTHGQLKLCEADAKPLPPVPGYAAASMALTIESRAHRAELIRHWLNDVKDPEINARREGWAVSLEEVLDEMSTWMEKENWVPAVRRQWEVRERRSREVKRKSEGDVVDKRKQKEKENPADKGKKQSGSTQAHPSHERPQLSPRHPSTSSLPFPSTPSANLQPNARLLASLAYLRSLVFSHPQEPLDTVPGHFLLCLTVPRQIHVSTMQRPSLDLLHQQHTQPVNIGCTFVHGSFILPTLEEFGKGEGAEVLFGLKELDDGANSLRLVGGTFEYQGLASPTQRTILTRILRASIFTHLSLVLEQCFLQDFGVQLRFQRPKLSLPSSSDPHRRWDEREGHGNQESNDEGKGSPKKSFPSGILGFFARRGFGGSANAFNRSKTIAVAEAALARPPQDDENSPRSSADSTSGAGSAVARLRKLSFISPERRYSSRLQSSSPAPAPSPEPSQNPNQPFTTLLASLNPVLSLLSSSPGVIFPLPNIVVELSKKEQEKPGRRLGGDERAGLGGLAGWGTGKVEGESGKEGKEGRWGRSVRGLEGFIRMQEMEVVLWKVVPCGDTKEDKLSTSLLESAISDTSTTTLTARPIATSHPSSPPSLKTCARPTYHTFRFYNFTSPFSGDGDIPMGVLINHLAKSQHEQCDMPGCTWDRGQHEIRLGHAGVWVGVRVAEGDGYWEGEEGDVMAYSSCALCGKESGKRKIKDGSFLLSYAKFLELIIYSPQFCFASPAICEHTTPPPKPGLQRYCMRRNFVVLEGFVEVPNSQEGGQVDKEKRRKQTTITFTLSPMEDIFELRVPRLQILRGGERVSRSSSLTRVNKCKEEPDGEDEKDVLRREIRLWWEGMAGHIDKLEHILTGDDLNAFRKALPRLPSELPYEEEMEQMPPQTPPKPPSISSSTPSRREATETPKGYFYKTMRAPPSTPLKTPTGPPLSHTLDLSSSFLTVPVRDPDTPEHLLAQLRRTFQKTEQSLYSQLVRISPSVLNDVRRSFFNAAQGAQRRLGAWQKKHLAERTALVGELEAQEPEWWAKGCHAVPGGNVIVREDDWGSIIAYTLRHVFISDLVTTDYQRELANLSITRTTMSSTGDKPLTPPTIGSSSSNANSSFFSVAAGYRLFSSSSQKPPDPDQEGIIWHEPEAYSAVISRKEHPKDPASLLSFREVLRQKAPTSDSLASRFVNPASGFAANTLPSAWAKPDVRVSKQAAPGEVSGLPETGAVESVEKIIHGIEATSPEPSRPGSALSDVSTIASGSVVDAHIRRGKASSVISINETEESEVTIGRDAAGLSAFQVQLQPPTVPPKDSDQSSKNDFSESSVATVTSEEHQSSFTSSLASNLGYAMRFVVGGHHIPRPVPAHVKNHHGLLLAEAGSIDERPHIKYDWTTGKRLKFSCTVYYAKQFDALRKRCGVDEIYVKSLARSTNWIADGGKSKSNFWKTADDRFIIKTLVNAWNVADLQVLIELGPSYFRYMESTASKATVLAKLLGFYTVEIRNLETGTVQTKADLLVMENLFFNRNIIKTFDLKGIHGRKVKANATQASKTLFDGEWIEGQQRTLTLVQPYSKNILREAIKSDAEFLSKSNIMDYSLLLGVDEKNRQIACGLVDTIGSYTFAKTLEYKAKHGLNSGKDVTVIPPAEYQERFLKALEGYFLACPDKWSKHFDDSKLISDPELLSSVL